MTNKKAIFLLFLANSISGCAQGISMIGLVWYMNAVLKMGSSYGVFYASVVLGSMVWSLFAGTIVDRHNRKNIFLVMNLFGALVLLGSALYGFYAGVVPFALSALVFASTTFIYNIHYPNLYAIAQEITEPKNYVRITSYIEIQGQATTVLSGALAAVLMQGHQSGETSIFQHLIPAGFHFAPWSIPKILLLDGITYFVSFCVIYFVRYTPIETRVIDRSSILERLKYGIQYLLENKAILIFGTCSLAVFISIIVNSYYLMPLYVDKFLQEKSDVFAGSELFFAFGALISGFFARYVFLKTNIVAKVIGLSVLSTICYLFFMINKDLVLFFCGSFLLGLSNAAIRIYRVSYLFKLVPNHVIGRVNGTLSWSSYFFRFLIGLLFAIPFFNESNGIIYSMFCLALLTFVGAILMFLTYGQLKHLDIKK